MIVTPNRGTRNTAVAGGVPADAVFHTDWSTALGSSQAARYDTGKSPAWNNDVGSGTAGQFIDVISASGLGFPGSMANCLQTYWDAAINYEWIIANNQWSAPTTGNSLYFRIYNRHAGMNNADEPYASSHPVESEGGTGGVSGNFYTFKLGNWADGTFPFGWQIDANTQGWSLGANQDAGHSNAYMPLAKNNTRRIEWKLTKTGTTLYSIDMRVYASNDVTLDYDRNNIYQWQGPSTMAAAGTNQPLDDAHVADFRLGKNGGWGESGSRVYWGGFAVRTADWCGAYNGSF